MQLETTTDLNDHLDSVEEAYEILRDIREKELKVVDDDFERRQKRIQSFHDYIQRQLDHPAQVLPELIQNADDINSCNKVKIELTDDALRIRNNGRPMKLEEVDTLCTAGNLYLDMRRSASTRATRFVFRTKSNSSQANGISNITVNRMASKSSLSMPGS